MAVETPEWVKHAVFYQIFPDRFARSPRTKHPRGVEFKPWGSPPEEQGYQGGDLRGVVDHLDYLKQLGVNAIYLNPIFASASNHRYHTFDYFQVDPLLGGNEALRELLDEAHAAGISVVLDGVFNHASRGFWQFHHILENGGNSPYIDWFIIHGWPLRPYRETEDHPLNYEAWIGLPALPKFNTDNPGVRDFIMSVARYWLDFGIDGWRLDVPFEIDDDSFWQEFRQVVKTTRSDAYIVGEVWKAAQRWLQGDQFDAVMNYIFARLAMSFFGAETLNSELILDGERHLLPMTAAQFRQGIDNMLGLYDWQINLAQMNMLDSHDTPRALWHMGEDKSALKLSTLLQMTMPGAPNVYYGTEIGMTGGPDPGCRGAFPWHDESRWDTGLLDHFRRAIRLRHQHPALRTGTFTSLYGDNGVYAFLRELDGQQIVAAFNANKQPVTVDVPLPQGRAAGSASHSGFAAVWGEGEFTASQGVLAGVRIPARDGVVLTG
jgi:cyclomaltodextrinase / maltogenic alpha-amylase / neopullulanase